jgi:hypothetical protein
MLLELPSHVSFDASRVVPGLSHRSPEFLDGQRIERGQRVPLRDENFRRAFKQRLKPLLRC